AEDENGQHHRLFLHKDHPGLASHHGGGGQNLAFHGGAVLLNAKIVAIFWGPGWGGSDSATMNQLISLFGQFGTTGEYNVITQYTDANGNHINPVASLLEASFWDSSTPPTNATDAVVQGEVKQYIDGHGFDPNAIYEVFLPATSYASFGTSDS